MPIPVSDKIIVQIGIFDCDHSSTLSPAKVNRSMVPSIWVANPENLRNCELGIFGFTKRNVDGLIMDKT